MVLVRNNEDYFYYFFVIYKDKIKNKCHNSKESGVKNNDSTICRKFYNNKMNKNLNEIDDYF